jgi:predicted RNA methylase
MRLFIKNLSPDIPEHSLREAIEQASGVRAPLTVHRDRRSASLHTQDQHQAYTVIARINGMEIAGQCIFASVAIQHSKPIDVKQRLFDTLEPRICSAMMLDQVAEYSVTPISQANLMSKMILCILDNSANVLDGTACVGGNTISFAKYFNRVTAVEMDSERFNMLKHNVKDVLDLKNVTLKNADIVSTIQGAQLWNEMDCVFLDPPWGGPDYKKHSSLQLYLGEISMPDLCLKIFKTFQSIKLICLKLPNNYAFDSLTSLQQELQKDSSASLHLAWSRFFNLSLVFLYIGSETFSEFTRRIRRFPVNPEDCVFTRVYSSDCTWESVIPDSFSAYLASPLHKKRRLE